MANDCLPQVQACMLRVTQLDGSGVPAPGASNMYVTDSLISLAHSPQYEEGTEIKVINGCGAVCVGYKAPPSFLRDDITLTLCTPDPQLLQLLTGGVVLTSGARVGGGAPPIGVTPASVQNGVSIELWAKRIRSGVVDATNPYAWWVFPKVTNLKYAGFTQENGVHQPQITGEAYENTRWYNGPDNQWPTAVATDRVWQWLPWNTIPTSACGYAAVAAT